MEVSKEVTNWKMIGVSLGVILLAVLLLSLGETIDPGWKKSVLQAFASSVLAVGALSVVYETLMRRSLQREFLRALNISSTLQKHQLVSVGRDREVDWTTFFDGSRRVFVLLTNPSSWIDQHWVVLRDLAKRKPLEINLIVPDPDWVGVEYISAYHGETDVDRFSARIHSAISVAESTWKADLDSGSLVGGGGLKITLMKHFPAYSVVSGEADAVVMMYSPTARRNGEEALFFRFSSTNPRYPLAWFMEELERLSKDPNTYFEREVRS